MKAKKTRSYIVKAQVTEGKYADMNFEITIGKNATESHVFCNGKELKNVQSAHIHVRVNKPTELVLIGLKTD